MGLESYRIAIKLKDNPPKECIVKVVISLGGEIVSKNEYGDIELEVKYDEGFIEILLENPAEKQKNIDKINEKAKINQKKENLKHQDKVRIYIRFAKPSSINIVEKIVDLIKNLDNYYSVEGVLDLESKELIDLKDYENFRQSVKQAREEFQQWFPGIKYPIRSKKVFEIYRKSNPNKVVK